MYPAAEPGVIGLGHRHFVLPTFDGGYLWWHDCGAADHVSWRWIVRLGDRTSGHVVEQTSPLTIAGSLICEQCGDHGFIRGGVWQPV